MSEFRGDPSYIREVPREERVTLIGEVSPAVKNAVNREDIANWKVMDAAIRMYLGLDDESTESAIERELKQVREEKNSIADQLGDLQEQLERIDERESMLEDQLESVRERQESYRSRVDNILDEMLAEPKKGILAWSSDLKDLARDEYGTEMDANIDRVVGDLRSRADERGLAIEPHRFNRSGVGPAVGGGDSSAAASTDGGTDDNLMHWSPNDDEAGDYDE